MIGAGVENSTDAVRLPAYASLARVGVIVPSANCCAEPELTAMAPDGVALFVTRLRLRSAGVADIRSMAAAAESAAELLADLDPALVLFHCTGASSLADDGFIGRIESEPSTSASRAASIQ